MKKKLLVFSKKIVLPFVHKILTQRTWIILKKSSSPVKDKRKDLNIARPSVHPSVHEIIYRFSRAKSEALINYILTKKNNNKTAMAKTTTTKSMDLISQKNVYVHHTFLYISLPLFCTTKTWNVLQLLVSYL